jgi:hypothetical protein
MISSSLFCPNFAVNKKLPLNPFNITVMNLSNIVRSSFSIGFVLSMIGAWMRIMHKEGAGMVMGISLLFTLTFMICAIYEVQASQRIEIREKIMWFIGIIFLNPVAGIIYFWKGRKRVVG